MRKKDEQAKYLFHQGTNYRSYNYLGSHFAKMGKDSGVIFRVWAPNAESVSLVGDFNGLRSCLLDFGRKGRGKERQNFVVAANE